MKCLSLFSGIGGFDLALRNLGHEIIGACEIDKYARQVYARHFPTVRIYEDARTIDPSELPDFNLLCAGFPCQAFSVAGKQLGFEDTRGTLFYEIARVAKEKRPRYLLLENVKGLLSHDGGRTLTTIIQTFDELGYDLEWQVINSKHFVPQNRERIYIIGHLRGESSRKIFPLGNSDEINNGSRLEAQEQGKRISGTIDSNYWKGGSRTMIQHIKSESQANRVYNTDGICPTLGVGHAMNSPNIVIENKLKRVEKLNVYNTDAQAGKIYDVSGISPTVSGQRINSQGWMAIPVLTPDRPEKRQNGRRFKTDGEPSFTLTAQDKHGIFDGSKIRRLTPMECERLQGFPDGYTDGVSDTQRYKCLGNAVTVPVVQYIASHFIPTVEKKGDAN